MTDRLPLNDLLFLRTMVEGGCQMTVRHNTDGMMAALEHMVAQGLLVCQCGRCPDCGAEDAMLVVQITATGLDATRSHADA